MALRYWGGETTVNISAADDQYTPQAAALTNGNYVITWADDNGSGSTVIRFQVFDAAGNRISTERTIPSNGGVGDQTLPQIAALADGGFVLIENDKDFSDPLDPVQRILAHRYSADGTYQSTSSLFNGGSGLITDIAVDTAGAGFAADFIQNHRLAYVNIEGTWIDAAPTSAAGGVDFDPLTSRSILFYAQTFAAPQFIFNIYSEVTNSFGTAFTFDLPGATSLDPHQIVWMGTGRAAALWTVDGVTSLADISVSGLQVSSVTDLPSGTADFNMTVLKSGTLAVTFSTPAGDTVLSLYDSALQRVAPDFIVNQSLDGLNSQPALAELSDGRILLTWSTANTSVDGSGSAILSQIIDPRDGIITGSNDAALSETLYGHNTLSDFIRGLAGNDVIHGLGGNDSIYGGDGNDIVNCGKGDDEAFGGRGDDVLAGGAGDDDLTGDAGNDILRGGGGADTLSGGTGIDTADYGNAAAGVTAALDGSTAGTGDAAGDVFSNVENLVGSAFSDVLRGNAGSNALTGGSGADKLSGVDGSDILIGGAGADTLSGGIGSDILIGGAGADTLSGGIDNDAFRFLAVDEGVDKITDFASAGDTIEVLGSAFGNLAAGASLSPLRFATGADHTLIDSSQVRFYFETGTQTLWYDSNGSLRGGAVALLTVQAGATISASDIVIF